MSNQRSNSDYIIKSIYLKKKKKQQIIIFNFDHISDCVMCEGNKRGLNYIFGVVNTNLGHNSLWEADE